MIQQPRKLQNLIGYGLKARDGEFGTLEEVYFDDRRWFVRYPTGATQANGS
jgi:hypothetical protein